jgi:hypothetical protein
LKNNIVTVLNEYHGDKDNKRKDSHLKGFYSLVREQLEDDSLELKKGAPIKEFSYRSKRWDFSIWREDELKAVIELKSLHKSAAKNFNNRIEEAVGCATFLKRAYPNVKTGYLCIGDSLCDKLSARLIGFANDCKQHGWYDGVCCILIDKNRNFSMPPGLSIDEMVKNLQQGIV